MSKNRLGSRSTSLIVHNIFGISLVVDLVTATSSPRLFFLTSTYLYVVYITYPFLFELLLEVLINYRKLFLHRNTSKSILFANLSSHYHHKPTIGAWLINN